MSSTHSSEDITVSPSAPGSPRVRKEKRCLNSTQIIVGPKLFTCNAEHASNDSPVDKNPAEAFYYAKTATRLNMLQHELGLAPRKSSVFRVASLPTISDVSSQVSGSDDEPSPKAKDDDGAKEESAVINDSSNLATRMREIASVPSLRALNQVKEESTTDPSLFVRTNPDDLYRSIIESEGFSSKPHAALELKDFFLETAEEHIASYRADIISAVRQEDIEALGLLHKQGRSLQCCNRFGESILHMACRRGSLNVVRFLLEEANVCLKVRDDYGRTPLHDACWTREPETQLVKMLVTYCPDLLLINDKRGFTPLTYVRKDHWSQWCDFLHQNRGMLKPQILTERQ